MPPKTYVVATIEKEKRRYLSRFVNYQPYLTDKKDAAMIFYDRHEAEECAARCVNYTGIKFGVVNYMYE